MRLLARLARRAHYFMRRASAEQEMDDEMRLHVEMETEDRIRRGFSAADARRAALIDFGGVERFKEDGRAARGVRPLEDLAQDAMYAARVLRKSPGFTFASIATLALGMAATTVVFSAMNALLFRPLPVSDPHRLFVVSEVWKDGQRSTSTDMAQYTYPFAHYLDVREATPSVFSGLAAFRYGRVSVRVGTEARAFSTISASSNYFQVLGVRPALGRLFSDTVEHFANPNPEVVLSYDLWTSSFASDSGIIGTTLFVDSRPRTIVGVAPAGFNGTITGLITDLWLPASDVRAAVNPGPNDDPRRRVGSVTMFGRLRPGLSREQAIATLNAIGPNIPPDQAWQRIQRMMLDPMVGVPAMARGAVMGFSGMLMLTAAMVLMIAAANIAGMLLARAAHRRREIAVRLALGAGRGRLVRQLVTESVALCLAGGAVGVVLARWLVAWISVVQPPIGIRAELDLRIDPIVLATAFGVALVAGIFAGLTPALQSTRVDLLSTLRGTEGGQPKRRARTRAAFVVGQLAMSVVLLVTAGLFTRAFQRALAVERGLDPRDVVVAEIDLGAHGYDQTTGSAFYARLMARLRGRPEIASAALAHWTPLSLSHNGEGIMLPDGQRVAVTYGVADEGYLETMRIPVVTGRSFDASDTRESLPAIVVNETLARRFWPNASPLGQQLKLGVMREVVGVVRDGKYRSLDEEPTAFAFMPFTQRYSSRMTIHARARGDLGAALAAVRTEVGALDPNIALQKTGSLSSQLEIYFLPQQLAAWCIGVFGLVGLALAALGIHGVIAYHVAQRTRELGIRVALGARRRDVLGTVLRPGFFVIGIGVAIGMVIAIAVGSLARSFLYGIGPADPLTVVTVPLALGAIALLASYLPARRAARVDPMVSLRSE
jgi:predicted permease